MKPQNKKKILYVHANNHDIGGADYCLFKLASELDKSRFQAIVCLGQRTDICNLYKREGIKVHIIDMERIKKTLNPLYLLKLSIKSISTIRQLRKIIRDEHIDLVHGNDMLDFYGPVAGFLEKIPRAQYVRWIIESPEWLRRLITQVVYSINDIVLTVSDGVARSMFQKDDLIPAKVTTCYDWIDMQKVGHDEQKTHIRKEFSIPPHAPLIGCVGRLDFWKGQNLFIQAALLVLQQHPEARFLLVGGAVEGRGRESYGKKLLTFVRKQGITKQVQFTGHRTDISSIMHSLDIFVHSSLTPDPLPGVVMEAMYCGLPVVGADAGGVPEEVADGRTGLLYQPGNPHQMAEKIISLLEDPQLRRQMGYAGRERVMRIFDKTSLCQKIQSLYEEKISQYAQENIESTQAQIDKNMR
ncbi:MAG: hypothetical protein COA36_16310 [Desulfotalea sp.]|nr:MAG: hypothetical protein COA36_16310 [Desulfotalea sp.]